MYRAHHIGCQSLVYPQPTPPLPHHTPEELRAMLGRNGASRPLRIALVTEYYYPHLGGVCEHVHFFAREARKYGHEVDIITSRIEGTANEPHVIRLGKSVPWY